LEDDLFSLGMVALSLGTNTSISQFYSFSTSGSSREVQLKDSVVQDFLFLLKKRYSKDLSQMIKKLIFPAKICSEFNLTKMPFGEKDRQGEMETNQNSKLSIDNREIVASSPY
jgi:hypothetical protein